MAKAKKVSDDELKHATGGNGLTIAEEAAQGMRSLPGEEPKGETVDAHGNIDITDKTARK